ncbi:MAG TPA: two-component regulator propeller domain-containing protein, partial [Pyrinomonadaceae bacterium]
MNRQLCGSAVLALGILIVCARCAFGLNPSLDVNQYARTSWKINEGFSKGAIWSIAQTPDGYLWLGTEFGLLRFDGVRTVLWEPPTGERLPSSDVRSLRAARDGRLWIGTVSGLVSFKDGKISRYPQLDGQIIEALLEDRDHTMWVIAGSALSKARLCRIQNDKTECYENSGIGVTTIYEDSKGNLWAGAMNGVWRWTPGPPKLYPMPGPAQRTFALIESEDGGILIARRDGISKMTNGRFETYAPTSGLEFPPDRLLRDRDGGLWVGALTEHGLLHIHHGRTDLFTPTDGLSGDTVTCVFEDREGNVWVSTTDGLDRFRDFAIPPISKEQGLSSRSVSALVAAKDGGLWLGTSDGLTLWNKEEVTIYRGRRPRTRNSILSGSATNPLPHSAVTVREIYNSGLRSETLFEDQDKIWVGTLGGVGVLKSDRFSAVPALPPGNIFSITGDRAGNVWISHDDALFHLHRDRLVERIPWANFGHNEPARALLYDAVQRGLWTGFRDGGVAFFKDGQVRASFTSAQGLGEGRIHGFYSDAHGTIWVATQGGLSRIEQGRVLTLTSQNGLGCNAVNWMIEDDAGSVWLYM